ARKNIDFAGLQGREAVLGGERRVRYLGRIAEYGGSHGLAEVDVETGPVAGRILCAEAREVRTGHAALHEALGLNVSERVGLCRRCANPQYGRSDERRHDFFCHFFTTFFSCLCFVRGPLPLGSTRETRHPPGARLL